MKPTIMDAGPLVAWFCVRDFHHDWAIRTFDRLPSGAIVCEAVLTEACHLVAKDGVPPASILKLVEQNDLVLVSLAGEIAAVRSLMDRYADTPMDFADACVTRLAEMHDGSKVCTTDSDFQVYRKNRNETIALLAPFSG
jgi:predicted nucleic acid-binding protein